MMQQIAIQPQFWILPIAAALVSAVAVFLIVGGVRRHKTAKRNDRYTSVGDGRVMTGIVAALFGGGAFIAWLVFLIPYSAEYLMFYRVTGQVESVTRSFSDGSGDLTVQPVVVLSDFDHPVVIDDSRIYSYVGDRVDLTCSIEWVPYGEDRINCFIAANR